MVWNEKDSIIIAMTNEHGGKKLKNDILRYLQKRERNPENGAPELNDIASDLGISKEDIVDQIDILESQGAVDSVRTYRNTFPKLTGIGKAILEEVEQKTIEISSNEEKVKPQVDSTELIEQEFQWDAFISHASEDKEKFVKSLAEELVRRGARIWYDDFALQVGDSLRRSIDKGLATSRYGIVVLSPAFFAKEWPQKELDGLIARERDGQKVVLPVWLDVSCEDVTKYSPTLADRVAAKASEGLDRVADQLWNILKPHLGLENATSKPEEDKQKIVGELLKPPQRIKPSVSNQQNVLLRVMTSTQLQLLRSDLTSTVAQYGLTEELGYKDILIGPYEPAD